MKKIFAVIFYFFAVFNFIKPNTLHATPVTYNFFSKQYEFVDKIKIYCLNPKGYLSSQCTFPSRFNEDYTKIPKIPIEKVDFDSNIGAIWEVCAEINGNSYVLQNTCNTRWLGMSIFPVPKLIFKENLDGTFKIKCYTTELYLKINGRGYLTTTKHETKATDFIFEPVDNDQLFVKTSNFEPVYFEPENDKILERNNINVEDDYSDMDLNFDINFCNIY